MAANSIASGSVTLGVSADPLVAGLNKASGEVDAWGVKAQASLKASTGGMAAAMSAAWEKDRGLSKAMAKGNWSGVTGPSPAEIERAQKAAKAHAERMRLHLDSFSKGGDGGKAVGNDQGIKDVAKGLKFGEMAALGLGGAIAAVGLGVAKAFDTASVEAFNASMQRSNEIAAHLDKAMAKFSAGQEFRAKNVSGLESWSAIQAEIKSSEKSLAGFEERMKKVRKIEEIQQNPGAQLAKSLTSWIPGLSGMYERADAKAKSFSETTKKQFEEAKQRIEALKGLSLLSGAQAAADPLVKGLDAALAKGKEFFNLVVGNSAAIRKETDAAIKGLRQAYDSLGMSPGAKAMFDRKAAGETDPNKIAEAALFAEAAARKQNTLSIDEQIKSMERQNATYGMTAEEAMRYDLIQKEATAGQLARFDELTRKSRELRAGIEAAMAPKLAGAVLAGTQEAYALEVRNQGFDIGDGNAVHKENGRKLEKIEESNKELLREVQEMRIGINAVQAF